MPSRPSSRQRNTAACTWTPSRSSDEPAITARSRGAGSPRPAATARARRCAGGRRRRRRSRCGRPRPRGRARPRRAAAHHLLVAVAERAARPAGERQQRVLLVDQRGDAAQRVELLPARRRHGLARRCRGSRRAARPPRRARGPLGAHAAEVRRRRRGSNSSESGRPSSARQPPRRGLDLRALGDARWACAPRTAASPPTAPSRGARGRGRRTTARAPVRSPLEPRWGERRTRCAVPSTS